MYLIVFMEKKKIIKELNQEFNNCEPKKILEFCINNLFKKKIVYVCSFGTESAIILDLISKIDPTLPIVLLNTHFLFEETLEYRKQLINIFKLENCTEILPDLNDLKKNDKNNDLWKTDPEKCCEIRKVLPLEKELMKYDAWISGRKSYHGAERENLKVFEYQNEKVVVNPIIFMKEERIKNYFVQEKIPRHPLYLKGYLSIGCTNCTAKTLNNKDIRSGRWVNSSKTECGIHKLEKES